MPFAVSKIQVATPMNEAKHGQSPIHRFSAKFEQKPMRGAGVAVCHGLKLAN